MFRLWETRLSGLMKLNSKHHVWTSSAHHVQSTIPKVKCGCCSLILWGCFSAAGTEGLVRVEEKLNAPNIEIPLMKTQSRVFRTSDWAVVFTFQQDSDPRHTARVAYTTLWMSLSGPATAWTWTQSICLEKPEMCVCPHPTWKSLRGEEINGRYLPKSWRAKLVRIKQKRTWGCKGSYFCNVLIWVFLFLIHLQSCDNSVFALSIWCMECRLMWGEQVI